MTVNLTADGLSLWYGTPDAPAPIDEVAPRDGASLIVGARPANPTNSVVVRYRVDGGILQSVPGRELRIDYQRDAQYFAVTFPPLPTGDVVEYSPVLTCGGRQVPAAHIASRFPSRFRLPPIAPRQTGVAPRPAQQQRFRASLGFVATVNVTFSLTQYVGDTAAGMRVNFLVGEGSVEGEGFHARVTLGSSDQMIVRRDGMGVVRIRATLATEDGAGLDLESGGYVDFGPSGYRRALAHDLPDRSPIVVSPLISTRHPRYAWLSRVQCVGIGETHLAVGRAVYHVYAVTPLGLTAAI